MKALSIFVAFCLLATVTFAPTTSRAQALIIKGASTDEALRETKELSDLKDLADKVKSTLTVTEGATTTTVLPSEKVEVLDATQQGIYSSQGFNAVAEAMGLSPAGAIAIFSGTALIAIIAAVSSSNNNGPTAGTGGTGGTAGTR